MSQLPAKSDRSLTVPRILGLCAWAGLLYGALAVANLPGDWGHAVCGAWGCGPPLQALVGCHLAWLVVLGPVAYSIEKYSHVAGFSLQRLGWVLILASVGAILGVIVFQRFTWWADASAWQQQFFWQRCGFVILTTTDVPLVQLLLCGLFFRWRAPNMPLGSGEATA